MKSHLESMRSFRCNTYFNDKKNLRILIISLPPIIKYGLHTIDVLTLVMLILDVLLNLLDPLAKYFFNINFFKKKSSLSDFFSKLSKNSSLSNSSLVRTLNDLGIKHLTGLA